MKVLILGGDGFCGWPTALYLSKRGHDITVVDNYVRRAVERELDCESLTPIQPLHMRCIKWFKLTGRDMKWHIADVASIANMNYILNLEKPEVVIHFAEQRSAPYSMRSAWHKQQTVTQNLAVTNGLLASLVAQKLDAHVIHLGTMGVYGYGGTNAPVIPEGYLQVEIPAADRKWSLKTEILHPTNPGSIYHMTKCLDQQLFQFYAKNDGIRITDLHQGIVWGTQTEETILDDELLNRFDYDGDYGTVLNRFLVQAVVGHALTVHGTGGQTRAFIHIKDTVRCIEKAIESPPAQGSKPRIYNQMTECHNVLQLAKKIAGMTSAQIAHVDNPRKEHASNDLAVANDSLLRLGLEPTTLDDGLMEEIMEVVARFKDRVNKDRIPASVRW